MIVSYIIRCSEFGEPGIETHTVINKEMLWTCSLVLLLRITKTHRKPVA